MKETKLQYFQYKLLHRILPTNTFLFRIGYKNTPNCCFCNIQNETIEHLFYECPHVINLWESLKLHIQNHADLILNLCMENVLFGIRNDHSAKSVNYIIILPKYYTYLHRCRCNETQLNLQMLLSFIKNKYQIRKYAGFPALEKIEKLISVNSLQ